MSLAIAIASCMYIGYKNPRSRRMDTSVRGGDLGYGFSMLGTVAALSGPPYGGSWIEKENEGTDEEKSLFSTFSMFFNTVVGPACTLYFGRFSLDIRSRVRLSVAIFGYTRMIDNNAPVEQHATIGIGPVGILDMPIALQILSNVFLRWTLGAQGGWHFFMDYDKDIHQIGFYGSLGLD